MCVCMCGGGTKMPPYDIMVMLRRQCVPHVAVVANPVTSHTDVDGITRGRASSNRAFRQRKEEWVTSARKKTFSTGFEYPITRELSKNTTYLAMFAERK